MAYIADTITLKPKHRFNDKGNCIMCSRSAEQLQYSKECVIEPELQTLIHIDFGSILKVTNG